MDVSRWRSCLAPVLLLIQLVAPLHAAQSVSPPPPAANSSAAANAGASGSVNDLIDLDAYILG